MKTKLHNMFLGALAFATVIAAAPTTANAQMRSRRVTTSELNTGIFAHSGVLLNDLYRGSATVVRHPKVLASAAHVTFENGAWLLNNRFVNRYHSAYGPFNNQGVALRGYWHWTNYADAVAQDRRNGVPVGYSSPNTFSWDFIAGYAYQDLAGGGYCGWVYPSNSLMSNSSLSKAIVGYPGSDAWYMNITGFFTSPYRQSSGQYFTNAGAEGGSGMSGGGVFVYHTGLQQYVLGGVHVSGGGGSRLLDSAAFDLMSNAITSAGQGGTTRTFTYSGTVSIPDGSASWTEMPLSLSGNGATLQKLNVEVTVNHPYRGDLEASLISPSGRSISLCTANKRDTTANLAISQDATASFNTSGTNGTWKLRIRDLAFGDVGSVQRFSLAVTSR
jgi:hypothetical protein